MKACLIILISLFTTLFAHAEVGTYEVKKGDQLMLISKKLYGTFHKWQKIVDANPGIKPKFLRIGSQLIIPDLAAAPEIAKATSVKPEILVETDEFTEESVLSLLDLKRKPANKKFMGRLKSLFKTEVVPGDRPVEGILLEDQNSKSQDDPEEPELLNNLNTRSIEVKKLLKFPSEKAA